MESFGLKKRVGKYCLNSSVEQRCHFEKSYSPQLSSDGLAEENLINYLLNNLGNHEITRLRNLSFAPLAAAIAAATTSGTAASTEVLISRLAHIENFA